jgi:hypothetical protein
MYRFIRDNNKKFMAIFAIVLMVAFLLPAGYQQMHDPGKMVRATLADGTPVTVADYQRAQDSWQLLQSAVVRPASFAQDIPLIAYLGDVSSQDLMMALQGQGGLLPFRVVSNYQTFLLLLKEAQAAGVVISDERLNEVMTTDVQIRTPVDPRTERRIREAVRDYLMVQASYARVASMAKASAPMRQRSVAQRSLKVSADVVEFNASAPVTAPTSQPTRERLQAHFDRYKDIAPTGPTTDSLGFGYRLPEAVKVQTLTLPADAVRALVEKSKTPRQWEVETRTYVYKNIADFPATQPASTQTASTQSASTQPAKGRTYDDLTPEQKQRARDTVMKPAIDALSGRIVAYLSERLAKDYTTANPATQPTTMPATAAGGGYLSYAYLEQVAQDVQKQFAVLPTVANHADWLDRDAATGLPGIGTATTSADGTGETFATMALNAQPISDGAPPGALRLNEFSRPLTDPAGNTYIFRVTEARKSQPPPSLDAVLPQVTADLARQDGLDTATTTATSLIDAAKTTDFTQAATATGKTVARIGPIDLQNTFGTIPGLDIPQADRPAFFRGVARLLSTETRDATGRPLGAVVLPTAGKVLAISLTAATVEPSPNGAFLDELAASLLNERDMNSLVTLDWFSFDSVAKRIGFQGDRPSDEGLAQ